MDNELRDQLKSKLENEKSALVAQLEDVTKGKDFNKEKSQAKWEDLGDKDEDNALEVADYQDSIALERSLEESLEKVSTALQKIDNGTFGVCESCGKEIEEARLEAYPQGLRCLVCTAKENV
jgi:DnaK suppressor protein